MFPGDDSAETLLEPADVLEVVAALGTQDRFEVAYTLYALETDAATVGEIAAETNQSELAIDAHVEELVTAGVVTERMACLVDPDVDGPEYELTEFGRLALEDGVLALFDAAETAGDVDIDLDAPVDVGTL